jgi:hypothetical protein
MSTELTPRSGASAELCLPSELRKPRLRRWEASDYLRIVHGLVLAPSTLAKLASIGGGPAYNDSNRTPMYPKDELDRWAAARLGPLITNTSQRSKRNGTAK